MPGLKKKFFFLDRPPARIWVIWVQIQIFFTIFHIEFAEKSQKIRTVALWYNKLYKKNQQGGRNPPPPPPLIGLLNITLQGGHSSLKMVLS